MSTIPQAPQAPQAPRGQTENHAALCSRIDNLRNELDAARRQNQGRHRILLIGGIALLVACVIGLSSLTSQVYQLDAHALTQIGRQQVERQLPGEMAALKKFLKEQAPKFISEIFDSSLGLVPNLRAQLVKKLDKRTETVTEEFEASFVDMMHENIVTTKARLEQLHPGMSDVDQLEKLVQNVSEKFQEGSTTAFRELYPHYAAEMNRVKAFLVDLQHRDEEELTEKQRLQKELIQTLLRLVAHAKASSSE